MADLLRRLSEAFIDKQDPSGRGSAKRLGLIWLSVVVGLAVLWLAGRHAQQPEWPLALMFIACLLAWRFLASPDGVAASVFTSLISRLGIGQRVAPPSTPTDQPASTPSEPPAG